MSLGNSKLPGSNTNLPSTALEKANSNPENSKDEKQNASSMATSIEGVVEEPNPNHLKGMQLVLVISVITLASFLMLMDASIISTAIPQITDEFHSLGDIGWYGSSYLVAYSAMQLLSGKLYSKFSTKWTYLGLFGIFELGSLLCGVARSSNMLIVGRAVAGMGGAGLVNGAMTIIGTTVPLHKQPAIIGTLIGIAEMGVVVGPIIGGAFTTHMTWRWCFFINLPIGAVVAVYLCFVTIPDQMDKPSPREVLANPVRELDLVGFVLFSGAAVMLLIPLESGGNQYAWNSAVVIGLFCGSAVVTVLWVFWNRRQGEAALVPASLATRRVVWACALTALFVNVTQIITPYYLPIYFQAAKNATALESGVDILPTILGQLFTAVLGGVLIQKLGYAIPFGIIGAVLLAVGNGLFTLFTPTTPTGMWVGCEILQGFGRGFAVQVPLVSIQAQSLPSEISMGTSIVMFGQTLGNAIFLTIANAVFQAGLKSTIPEYAPSVNADEILALGATGFRAVVTPNQLPGVLDAYAESVGRVFYVGVATAGVSLFTCLFVGWVDLRKKKPVASSESE